MNPEEITAKGILGRMGNVVAPLPCQEEYLRQLAAIFSFHIHKN